jgi:hypothetical protein
MKVITYLLCNLFCDFCDCAQHLRRLLQILRSGSMKFKIKKKIKTLWWNCEACKPKRKGEKTGGEILGYHERAEGERKTVTNCRCNGILSNVLILALKPRRSHLQSYCYKDDDMVIKLERKWRACINWLLRPSVRFTHHHFLKLFIPLSSTI